MTETFIAVGDCQDTLSELLHEWGIVPEEPYPGRIGAFKDNGDLLVKLEMGLGGSDPFVEAIHCYLEQLLEFTQTQTDPAILAKVSFPAILLLHFGPYLAVAAVAYTDQPIAEHLACVPLHMHSTNTEEAERGSRVLSALRVALHDLRETCPTLPSRGPVLVSLSATFMTMRAIEDSRAFRAHLVGPDSAGKRLYVKFSVRYSEEAHRAAHAIGLAPELHAVNDVYGWYMAVMDDRSSAYTSLWDLKENGDIVRHKWVPVLGWAQEAVQEKLALLHERGFVHGDVRDANVLVRNTEGERDVLLVDWDWAGATPKARYPYTMSRRGIDRPGSAMPGEQITPEHDNWMSERLLTRPRFLWL
ncbi:hypothetical protein OE88DRAFT_1643895 [Heliocybe sulcata]|uniref:Uncharacterized protein n=1 Tax=Heliocybe sulcata TaxID=5364 RepID=A0A5C3N7I1_9AGAM|nr:hypothetical protein OE88DRAFT_1643895 [Heliocybe sulcata]